MPNELSGAAAPPPPTCILTLTRSTAHSTGDASSPVSPPAAKYWYHASGAAPDGSSMELWTPFRHILAAIPRPSPLARIQSSEERASAIDKYQFLVTLQPEIDKHVNYLSAINIESLQRLSLLEHTHATTLSTLSQTCRLLEELASKDASQRIELQSMLSKYEQLQARLEELTRNLNRWHGTPSIAERKYMNEVLEYRSYASQKSKQIAAIEGLQQRRGSEPIEQPEIPRLPQMWIDKFQKVLSNESQLIKALKNKQEKLRSRVALVIQS